MRSLIRFTVAAFTVAAVVYALRTRQNSGRLLGVPYDFRKPTFEKIRLSVWNAEEDRIFVPSFFGVGWSVNLHQVLKQLRDRRPVEGDSRLPEGPDS